MKCSTINKESSFQECHEAYKKGSALGYLYLSRFYLYGIDVKKNITFVAVLLENAWRQKEEIPYTHLNFFYWMLVYLAYEYRNKQSDYLFLWRRAIFFKNLSPEPEIINIRLSRKYFHIAKEYETGSKDYPQDKEKAFHLYNQSAEMGYANAMNNIGVCYAEGIGTEINPKKAARWFWIAAFYQCQEGVDNLANCYETGFGVWKNTKEAAALYKFKWSQKL